MHAKRGVAPLSVASSVQGAQVFATKVLQLHLFYVVILWPVAGAGLRGVRHLSWCIVDKPEQVEQPPTACLSTFDIRAPSA
jgi:hypothetical protein